MLAPSEPHIDRQIVTAKEVATVLQISEDAVFRLTREGKLPVVRIGRFYRYDLGAIARWIDNGGAK